MTADVVLLTFGKDYVFPTFGTDVNYGPFWHMLNISSHTSANSVSLALVMRFAP